jgi:hypothetical protein
LYVLSATAARLGMSIARQWVRLYTSVLDDPKIQRLPDSLFRFWIDCILICGLRGGYLPSTSDCAFRMRISQRQVIARLSALKEARLVDETPDGFRMHDWQEYQYDSDSSTDRVKRFRERSSNVSETLESRAELLSEAEAKLASQQNVSKSRNRYLTDEEQSFAETNAVVQLAIRKAHDRIERADDPQAYTATIVRREIAALNGQAPRKWSALMAHARKIR